MNTILLIKDAIKGYKTYICAACLLVSVGLYATHYITQPQFLTLVGLFGAGALAALRAAVGDKNALELEKLLILLQQTPSNLPAFPLVVDTTLTGNAGLPPDGNKELLGAV